LDIRYNASAKSGRILVSFNFFKNEPVEELSIYPKMKQYDIKFRVLGMRDLKSLGLMPVKRAYCKFDVNSLRPKDKK